MASTLLESEAEVAARQGTEDGSGANSGGRRSDHTLALQPRALASADVSNIQAPWPCGKMLMIAIARRVKRLKDTRSGAKAGVLLPLASVHAHRQRKIEPVNKCITRMLTSKLTKCANAAHV